MTTFKSHIRQPHAENLLTSKVNDHIHGSWEDLVKAVLWLISGGCALSRCGDRSLALLSNCRFSEVAKAQCRDFSYR